MNILDNRLNILEHNAELSLKKFAKELPNNINSEDVLKTKQYFSFYIKNLVSPIYSHFPSIILSNKKNNKLRIDNYITIIEIIQKIENLFDNQENKIIDFFLFLEKKFNNKEFKSIQILKEALEYINQK